MRTSRVLLVTGRPGVGKTTLIERLTSKYSPVGFITEERREDRRRVGFDVVPFDGNRFPLARIRDRVRELKSRKHLKRVGKYLVDTITFELFSRELWKKLLSEGEKRLVVIDEIGPMELTSEVFRRFIIWLLEECKCKVIATIKEKGNVSRARGAPERDPSSPKRS